MWDDDNARKRRLERINQFHQEQGMDIQQSIQQPRSGLAGLVQGVGNTAQGIGTFAREGMIDPFISAIQQTSGDIYDVSRGIGASRRMEQSTEERNRINQERNAYLETLNDEDFDNPEVQARLQEFEKAIEGLETSTEDRAKLQAVQDIDATKSASAAAENFLNVATLGVGGLATGAIRSGARAAGGAISRAGAREGTEAATEGAVRGRIASAPVAASADESARISAAAREFASPPASSRTPSVGQRALGGAGEGATFSAGGSGLYEARMDGDLGDIAGGVAMGGAAGGVLGGMLGGVAGAIARRRTGSQDAQPTRVDEVAAAESPIMRAVSQSDEATQGRFAEVILDDPSLLDRAASLNDEQASGLVASIRRTIEPEQPTPSQLSPDELALAAERPQGMTPDDYIANRTEAADVTPGSPELVADIQQPQTAALEVTPGQTQQTQLPDVELPGAGGGLPAPRTAPARPSGYADEGSIGQSIRQENIAKSDAIQQSTLDQQTKDAVAQIAGEGLEDISDAAYKASYNSVSGRVKQAVTKVQNDIDTASTSLSRQGGKAGADIVASMQMSKADVDTIMERTIDNVRNIERRSKDISFKQQRADSLEVAGAIESGDASRLTGSAKELYDNIVPMWNAFKESMTKRGRPVRDDYFSTVVSRNPDESASTLIDAAMKGELDDFMASFSRQRTGGGQIPNLYETAGRYQRAMAKDLTYRDAVESLSQNMDDIPASVRSNSKAMSEFTSSLTDLLDYTSRGAQHNPLQKFIDRWNNRMTGNVLGFSIKKAGQDFTDIIKIRGYLSPEAKGMDIPKNVFDDFSENFRTHFSGVLGRQGERLASRSRAEILQDRLRPGVWSEDFVSAANARDALRQGIYESSVYRQALQQGDDHTTALTKAWSQDKDAISRTASAISSIQPYGNSIGKAPALRGGKLFGLLPESSVTRFMSYPLSNLSEVTKHLNAGDSNALMAFQKGNLLNQDLATIRVNGKRTLDAYKKMAERGDMPPDVARSKIQGFEAALKHIDEALAVDNPYSKNKIASTYGKVMLASTLIAMGVWGVQDSILGTTRSKSPVGAAISEQPFLPIDRVADPSVNFLPIESSYGNLRLNARPLVTATPFLGGADQMLGSPIGSWANEQLRPVNRGLRDLQD